MGQEAADVVAGRVRDLGVAHLVPEQVLALPPQRLVRVHPAAVVLEDRLGHERDRLARQSSRVFDRVLVLHDVVRGGQEFAVADVDL